jgi:hypothetical protein
MNTRLLERRLAAQGMSPEELAAKIGLSVSYIKLVLRGLTPARHTLRHMALILDCEVRDLLGDPVSNPDGGSAA